MKNVKTNYHPNQITLFDEPEPEPAPKPVPQLYICHRSNGEDIHQRRSDGYFDATAMCRAYGKKFNDYSRLDATAEYLAEVESDTGIPASLLIESNRTGPYSTRGTWVHPDVGMDLAAWLSAKFKLKVYRWVMAWLQGRQPAISAEPFAVGNMLDQLRTDYAGGFDQLNRRIDNAATQFSLLRAACYGAGVRPKLVEPQRRKDNGR